MLITIEEQGKKKLLPLKAKWESGEKRKLLRVTKARVVSVKYLVLCS